MHDSPPDPLGADLALALALADLADEITMTRFRAIDLAVETKPDMTPVSEADTQVERTLRGHLETARPHDAILGEEYGQLGGESPNDPSDAHPQSSRRWIIDPIDGTQGYVRGVPVWATLIALEVHAEPVVGVVSAPALGRRWWASRGGGAHLREAGADAPRPLSVSRVSDLGDAQLCFGGLEDWRRQGRERQLRELAEKVWRTRGFGDFWQYMLVAEGAAEIASDPSVSIWDLAAPLVIVTEAGGRFTDFSGTVTAGGRSALATNGRLHEVARGILAAAGPAT
ncbi:MAG TPA: inositol monophosphatase family protein [Solirubrobacteraceae bacterium]|nr:inositol monophosphatase family protein [Solirubrobacteraceae bacterium]